MKKILLFLGLFLMITSCKQESELVFEEQVFIQKSTLSCTDDQCSVAEVHVPVMKEANTAAKTINAHVQTIVGDIIAFDQENHQFASYDEILKSFIASYDDIKKSFPNEPMPWEAKVNVTKEVFNDKIVNFVFDYYTFTGGAHGNPGVISVFYNTETGNEVPQKELFLNYEGFKKLVKEKFYKEHNLAANASLNDNGFMFEGNTFYLPENIIITSNEVIVRYNHYEIASYADGPTELKFSYQEVKPFLNELYFK